MVLGTLTLLCSRRLLEESVFLFVILELVSLGDAVPIGWDSLVKRKLRPHRRLICLCFDQMECSSCTTPFVYLQSCGNTKLGLPRAPICPSTNHAKALTAVTWRRRFVSRILERDFHRQFFVFEIGRRKPDIPLNRMWFSTFLQEKQVLDLSSQLPRIVEKVLDLERGIKTSLLLEYLLRLSRRISVFYRNCQILKVSTAITALQRWVTCALHYATDGEP